MPRSRTIILKSVKLSDDGIVRADCELSANSL